jgi:hypothetical protein
MRDRREPLALQPGLATQRPLASDDCVVAKGCERKTFRSSAAAARRGHGGQRTSCAERIGTEVPRPPRHPARMAAAGAEANPARIKGDPVRPGHEPEPERCVARARESGKKQRNGDGTNDNKR